jgi:DNA-binding IclR family transcriptional regulator
VTRAECRRIIALARKRGYARHTGIMVDNLSGIAVPLIDRRGGTIASISIALLTEHLDNAREQQVVDAFRRETVRLEGEIRPAADTDFGGRRRAARRSGVIAERRNAISTRKKKD